MDEPAILDLIQVSRSQGLTLLQWQASLLEINNASDPSMVTTAALVIAANGSFLACIGYVIWTYFASRKAQ